MYQEIELILLRDKSKLYYVLGCPIMQNFKYILQQNIIKNCPITVEDINIVEQIYGPDIATMKGKTTKQKVGTVKQDEIKIPCEQIDRNQEMTLCMVIMFVNRISLLATIDCTVKYRSIVPIKSR